MGDAKARIKKLAQRIIDETCATTPDWDLVISTADRIGCVAEDMIDGDESDDTDADEDDASEEDD